MILTKYRWLVTNVPETLYRNCYRWESWLRDLTFLDISNLRMNITGLKHYRYLIEDKFDNYEPRSEGFEFLIDVHTHLVELLFRFTR